LNKEEEEEEEPAAGTSVFLKISDENLSFFIKEIGKSLDYFFF
jgi:hypothetical protein